MKYRIINQFAKKYSVKAMCAFFNVSRSGYYAFEKRKQFPDKDIFIAEQIKQCQSRYGCIHGYRYVHLWLLKKKHIHLNPKTVLRIMRKYGLLSQIRRKRYRPGGTSVYKYANLMNRNFKASTPNSKWVTDISYIPTKQGFLYLSIIRDLFDNSIVSYKISRQQNIALVIDTIKSAGQKEKIAGKLQLHSDQGFQYCSQAYFNLTKEYGIIPSMSRRANPHDNAMAENFFSILKTECINRQMIDTFEQAQQLIDDYIYFYNFERFQMKYRLTPFEKRCQSA